MLVSFALGDANFLRWPCTFHFLCVDFFALGSKRKPHFQWNIGCVGSLALGLCVGHVHFIFFGHPTQTVFFVEYGLKCKDIPHIGFKHVGSTEFRSLHLICMYYLLHEL